jgi:hypothetical protein
MRSKKASLREAFSIGSGQRSSRPPTTSCLLPATPGCERLHSVELLAGLVCVG